MRTATLPILLCLAASAGASPVLDFSFPDYRMAVSPSADYPNEMYIAVHEHLSNYSSLEATWDFPGTVEVDSRFGLTLTASTQSGEGSIYLTATGYDGESLSVAIAVEVVTPYRPLQPVGLTCGGETEDQFVALWKFQERQPGFPEMTGVDYQITGPGLDEEGSQWFGSGDDKRKTQFQVVAGLQSGIR